jgi:hypothetical protein
MAGWRRGALFALLVLAQAAAATAQPGSAVLTGMVRDAAGQAIADAVITVSETATSLERSATTGDAGIYTIGGLLSGVYRIAVESIGFQTYASGDITVATGETVRVDVTLAVAPLSATVEVAASSDVRRVDSPGIGHVVDGRRLATLPLNGRSFVPLVALAPGVALPPGSAFPRINGGRPRTNEYLFDGISVLQPEPGQVPFLPVIDAIQDFKIESNSPPAEFGRFNGGVVNLTTRAGGNTLRATVFEYFRHEALNARHVFAPRTETNPDKPLFRRNQFGFVAGGPVVRSRTFFFADYQGTRQRIGRVSISTVPTQLQRRGIFTEPVNGRVASIYDPASTSSAGGTTTRTPFPGNAIPAERLDAAAVALLQRYPLPTSAGTSNNYRRLGTEDVRQDQVDGRIDQRLRHGRAFARLSLFDEHVTPVTPLPDGSGNITSGAIGDTATRAAALATSYQQVLGGRVLHEVRGGYTRRSVRRRGAVLDRSTTTTPPVPNVPVNDRFADALPTFVIDGLQQLGSPASTSSDFRTDVTQLVDAWSWAAGPHWFKAGADLRWSRLDVMQPPSPAGMFRFTTLFTDLPGTPNTGSALASFLLGQVQTFSIDLQERTIRPRAHVQEYFVQDEWKATARLTVNAGLRYTLNFPSVDADDQSAVFNLTTRQLEFLGRDGQPRAARQLHKMNFGPRLGISARATDAATLRGGFGVVWIEQAGITTPFTAPQFPFLQTVSQRTLDNVVPAFALADGPTVAPLPLTPDAGLGQGVFAVDRDLGSGYVQQWHGGLRHRIGGLSLEATYVGSAITRVGIPDTNLNQLTVDQLALGPELLQRVPNPYYGEIPRSSSLGDETITVAQLLKPYPEFTTVSLYRNNVGTTRYHGLELRAESRIARALAYQVSYTRSRLVDDASSVFDAAILTGPVANAPVADSFNRRLERDVSNGDIPHVLVASVLWDLPAGQGRAARLSGWAGALLNDWTLTSVLTLQSGTPIAITQATNFNAFAGFGIQRPNRVGDPELPAEMRTTSRWFDTSAFAVAPQFTLGSSSRNPVRGPAYRNVDLALIRRVALPGRRVLELRLEAFNAINTPALGAPNGVLGTPAFGSITTAGDPRVLQAAVRIEL